MQNCNMAPSAKLKQKKLKEQSEGKTKLWEKARRDRLKAVFDDLMRLLPKFDGSLSMSRIDILQSTIGYIKELRSQNEDLLNGGFDDIYKSRLAKSKKRVQELLCRIDQLSELLRSAKIPLPPFAPIPLGEKPKSLTKAKEEKTQVRKEDSSNGETKKTNKKRSLSKSEKILKSKKSDGKIAEKPPTPQKENQSGNANGTANSLSSNLICPTNTFIVTPQGSFVPIVPQPNPNIIAPIVIQRPPQLVVLHKEPQLFHVVTPSPLSFPLTLRKTPANKKRISRATTVTTYVNKKPIPALLAQPSNKKTPEDGIIKKRKQEEVSSQVLPIPSTNTVTHTSNNNDSTDSMAIVSNESISLQTDPVNIPKEKERNIPFKDLPVEKPTHEPSSVQALSDPSTDQSQDVSKNSPSTASNSVREKSNQLKSLEKIVENPTSNNCNYKSNATWLEQPIIVSSTASHSQNSSTSTTLTYSQPQPTTSNSVAAWSCSNADSATSWTLPPLTNNNNNTNNTNNNKSDSKKTSTYVDSKSCKETSKDATAKSHINWMTDPDVRTSNYVRSQESYLPDDFYLVNDKAQKYTYQSGNSYSVDYCFGGFTEEEKGKKKKRPEQELFSQDYFSWNSGKIDSSLVVPCTLPTLVGDLALGTNLTNEVTEQTDAVKGKSKDDSKHYVELAPMGPSKDASKLCSDLLLNNPFLPDTFSASSSKSKDSEKKECADSSNLLTSSESFANLSKNIFDVTAEDASKSQPLNETIVLKNIFELPPSKSNTSLKRAAAQQNSFFSVSQLVDTNIETADAMKTDSAQRHADTSYCSSKNNKVTRKTKCDKKYQDGCKFPSNYSAESLIRSNYAASDLYSLPHSHIYPSFESNKQDPLIQNVYPDFNFSSPVPNFTFTSADYLPHDPNLPTNQTGFLGDLINNNDYSLNDNTNVFQPPSSTSVNPSFLAPPEKRLKARVTSSRQRKEVCKISSSGDTFSSGYPNCTPKTVISNDLPTNSPIISFSNSSNISSYRTSSRMSSVSYQPIDNRLPSPLIKQPSSDFSLPYLSDVTHSSNTISVSNSTSSSKVTNVTSSIIGISSTTNYTPFPHQSDSTNHKYFVSPPTASLQKINHKMETSTYMEPDFRLKSSNKLFLPETAAPVLSKHNTLSSTSTMHHYNEPLESAPKGASSSITPFPSITNNQPKASLPASNIPLSLATFSSSLSYSSSQFPLYTGSNQCAYSIPGSSNLYNPSTNSYNHQSFTSLPNYKSTSNTHSISMTHSNSIFSTTLTTAGLSFPPPACSFAPLPATTANNVFPTSSSTSNTLTNFNLSTIFPEINKKNSYPVYP